MSLGVRGQLGIEPKPEKFHTWPQAVLHASKVKRCLQYVVIMLYNVIQYGIAGGYSLYTRGSCMVCALGSGAERTTAAAGGVSKEKQCATGHLLG